MKKPCPFWEVFVFNYLMYIEYKPDIEDENILLKLAIKSPHKNKLWVHYIVMIEENAGSHPDKGNKTSGSGAKTSDVNKSVTQTSQKSNTSQQSNPSQQNNSDSGNTNELTGSKSKDDTIIDELVKVARFGTTKEDIGNKHENDIGEDGFHYFSTYFMDFNGKYYRIRLSSALNEQNETVYSIGNIKERRLPSSDGSSSKNGALKNGRKSSNSIIYTTEDKSQEVKTAIQLAFEKAFKKQSEKSKVENNITGPKSKDDTIIRHILIKIILLIISKKLSHLKQIKKRGFII